jgi:diguanylate cyclase (GGDEF)-like protein
MRILIADDDATSRLVLTGVLVKNGHDVVTTVDGTGAWEAMQQPDAPKLAILDWMMPGLSGVDVCRRVRDLASERPPYLIILTSRDEKADIVAGLDAGADDYLAKPFDAGELRARVEVGRRIIELQETLSAARDALAFEARHDPLTGALNRRAFHEILSRELIGERRHGHGLALGICDVDQFKKVNDMLGHQAGDEVLCGIVRLVEATLRGHDVLGRYGGDEFVVLTDHHADEDAAVPYERARAAVAEHAVRTKAGDALVTISFGVRIWRANETEDELLAAADAALYRAKAGGRDRVVVAGAS